MITEAPHTQLSSWLACLSDPTRMRLLALLQDEELGVGELCEVLQLPQSTASRHLKVLAEQGWVHHRRRGTANLYRLDPEELDGRAAELWELTRRQTADWAEIGQDRLRLKQLRRRSGAEAFFADAAGHWGALRRELYGDAYPLEAMIALLPTSWTVADLGCGTGELAARLAGTVERVIGVDQSAGMLDGARALTEGKGNVELVHADLCALPLPDRCCDAALMQLVLSYLPGPAEALAEMARILRPGGKAVVVDLMRHDREEFRREMGQLWPGFEAAALTEMMNQAGLEGVSCTTLAPQPGAKGPALLLANAITPNEEIRP
jgi:SAM-dependent methyltransferase